MHVINPMLNNKTDNDLASRKFERCVGQIILNRSISPLTNFAMNWSMQHIFNDIGHDVSTPFNHNIGIHINFHEHVPCLALQSN